jgi:hypothetical protein
MTCLLPAALTMRGHARAVIGTASAADVYANETGWWHDGGAGYANMQATVVAMVVGEGADETRDGI